MKNGIYVVETKGDTSRYLVKIYTIPGTHYQQVTFFNDPDEDWNVEQLLDSFEVITQLDLNSFVKDVK